MSYYDWRNPKVGDLVYPPYMPRMAGVVFKVDERTLADSPGTARVHYKVRDGRTFSSPCINLNCFRELVESHERKAKAQREVAEALEALV